MIKTSYKISVFVLLILFGIIVSLRIIYPPFNILSWDVFGYYLYLPAQFIYHDIGISDTSWFYKSLETYHQTPGVYQLYPAADGMYLIKYSIGLSLLYSPFFFIAHFYALLSGYPADGFSAPYQYVMVSCALFYTLIGLVFLRKILLYYFSDKLTSVLMVIIVLGTNYLNNTTIGGLMSHNFMFTLFAVFLWYTIKWCDTGKFKFLIFIAISGGLILISRPNEAVCLIIPLLWGVKDLETLKQKFIFLIRNKYKLLFAFIILIFVISPQLIYWKVVTGSFITYTYQNPGEGLDFFNPHTIDFLFSFRKGWFVYTPVIVFAFVGLYFLFKRKKEIFLATIIYLLLSIYLVSSWTCWWYAGGCYSQRAIMSTYIILALPFGFLIQEIIKKKWWIRLTFFIIVSLLVCLNIFQFWQFHKGIINHDRMTRPYYFYVFGRTSIPPGAEKYLLIDRFKPFDESHINKYKISELGRFNFSRPDDLQKQNFVKDPMDSNQYCLKMDSTNMYSGGINLPYHKLTDCYYSWIKTTGEFYFNDFNKSTFSKVVCHFTHKGGVYDYQATEIIPDTLNNGWQKFCMYFLTPEVRSTNDTMSVYIWQRSKKPLFVRNFIIEVLEPKSNNP